MTRRGGIGLPHLAPALGVLAFVGVALALAVQIHLARLALKRVDRAQRDYRKAEAVEPAPHPVATQGLELAFEHWREARDLAEESFFGHKAAPDTPAEPQWSDSAAAYFAITRFAAELRERAERHDVAIAPELWFGFADYRREAPPAEKVAALWADRVSLGGLLAALLEAGPDSLRTVQREVMHQGGKGSGGRGKPQRDGFVADPAWQADLGAGLVGRAFRFVFVGDTIVLRRFVNALARPGRPWLVISVDARPVAVESGDPTDDGETWVRRQTTEFSVVVEVIERHTAGLVPVKTT